MARTIKGINALGNVALGIAQGLRDRRLEEENKRRWEAQQAEGQRRFDASYGLQEEENRRANQQAGMQREQHGQNQKVRRMQLMNEALGLGSKFAITGNLQQAEELFGNLGMSNLQWDDPDNPQYLKYASKDKTGNPVEGQMPIGALKIAAGLPADQLTAKEKAEMRKDLYKSFAESGMYDAASIQTMVDNAMNAILGGKAVPEAGGTEQPAPTTEQPGLISRSLDAMSTLAQKAGTKMRQGEFTEKTTPPAVGQTFLGEESLGYGGSAAGALQSIKETGRRGLGAVRDFFEVGKPVPRTQGRGPFVQGPLGQTGQPTKSRDAMFWELSQRYPDKSPEEIVEMVLDQMGQ